VSDAELPSGWSVVPLGEVGDVQLGKMLDRAKRIEGESLPYLRNQNVRWRAFDLSHLSTMPFKEKELERYSVRPGDVLVCEGGEPGRAAIWRQPEGALKYQKALHRVRLDEEQMLPEWLVLRLQLDASTGQLVEYFTGTTIKHFTRRALRGYRLTKPPVLEQRRIVARIESLQARSRRAKEALDAIPPLLERFRQSVLAAAFRGDLTADWRRKNPDVEPTSVLLERIRAERKRRWIDAETEKARSKAEAKARKAGKPWTEADDRKALEAGRKRAEKRYKEPEPVDPEGLPELPEGWCWTTMGTIAEVQLGQRRAPEYAQDDVYPYIRSANIKWTGLDLSDVKEMGFADPEQLTLKPGDLLLNEASGSPTEVGKPALWRGEIEGCCFQATVVRLRLYSDEVDPEWLYFNRLRDAVLAEYKARCPGIGIIHLTAKIMRGWPVPLSPAAEQKALAAQLRNILGTVHDRARGTEALMSQLGMFDQAVLAQAFRGELVRTCVAGGVSAEEGP
jgi:type I restriction enzyme, S subunit